MCQQKTRLIIFIISYYFYEDIFVPLNSTAVYSSGTKNKRSEFYRKLYPTSTLTIPLKLSTVRFQTSPNSKVAYVDISQPQLDPSLLMS